jgi:hypothetical protein
LHATWRQALLAQALPQGKPPDFILWRRQSIYLIV